MDEAVKQKTSAIIISDLGTTSQSLDRLVERLEGLYCRISGPRPRAVEAMSGKSDISESVFNDVVGRYMQTHRNLLDRAHALMNDIEDHF